jgi:hypothetical protein
MGRNKRPMESTASRARSPTKTSQTRANSMTAKTTKMTRQHFELIANLLHRSRTALMRTGDARTLAQFDVFFVPLVCEELKETNPQFKPELFAHAVAYGTN